MLAAVEAPEDGDPEGLVVPGLLLLRAFLGGGFVGVGGSGAVLHGWVRGGRRRAATGSDCLQSPRRDLSAASPKSCNLFLTCNQRMASKSGGKKKRTVTEVGLQEGGGGGKGVFIDFLHINFCFVFTHLTLLLVNSS